MNHTFHIPVLGLAFSIDSPIKVAQYGISSAVSIVDDELTERLREYYSKLNNIEFKSISKKEVDARAKRLTAYLDMMQDIIDEQIETLKSSTFECNDKLHQYFKLLPANNDAYKLYQKFISSDDTSNNNELEKSLKSYIQPGEIIVNIMSKVDKENKDNNGELLESIYSDAVAAIRAFANSKIKSTVVLSAGMNPRLYNYLTELPQLLPSENGTFDKKIGLKVSDYRSAIIQAKYLAKKGIWVSEFRVESGLNCGGHAFATDGFLLGPILEEFKQNRNTLVEELLPIYKQALKAKNINLIQNPTIKITAQGGIGTAQEHQFLLDHYQLDGIGWGSPFLLVPEATTVDDHTLQNLASATKEDFYLSNASPLGVPFHNFRKSTAEIQRNERIQKNRAGAPCTKKYLVSNSDFSAEPICTASREYLSKKLKELELLQELNFIEKNEEKIEKLKNEITEKTCLCEGLAASAYLKYDIAKNKENTAVAICPGPNTAYFNKIYTLEEMTNHIYGRENLLKEVQRPTVFINELRLYVEYIEKYIKNNESEDSKKIKYINSFIHQLINGINYYKELGLKFFEEKNENYNKFLKELLHEEHKLTNSII